MGGGLDEERKRGMLLPRIEALAIIQKQQAGLAGQHSTVDAILKISVQLLLPFIAGQIARRWIGEWVGRNKSWLKFVDQGSILLVVYGAFSEAVNEGIWHQIPLWELGGLVVACCVLLALVLKSRPSST